MFWTYLLQELLNWKSISLFSTFFLTSLVLGSKHHDKLTFKHNIALVLYTVLLPVESLMEYTRSEYYQDLKFIYQIFWIIAFVHLISLWIFKFILPKLKIELAHIIQDLFSVIVIIIALLSLASRNGYNVSGIIATSTVITAIIGFSMQDTLGNLISGISLQFDNSIKVGDWITINEITGRVTEVRWRYTSIETKNWETLIIPNSSIIKNQILILGKRKGQPVKQRRWVYFNVDFRYPPSYIISVVTKALQTSSLEIQTIAQEPPLNCVIMKLNDSYATYAVRYWLNDLQLDDPTDSDIRTWIYSALKREGISLSIPAQSVFVTEKSDDRMAQKNQELLKERIETLKNLELFKNLSEIELEHLAVRLRNTPFTHGEIITRQGAEAHWLYIMYEGSAQVNYMNEEGLEVMVGQLNAGDFFGEMSLMTGESRSSTVIALTDVNCYRLDKEAFQSIIKARPDIADYVAKVLTKRKEELEQIKIKLDLNHKETKEANHISLIDAIKNFFGLPMD